MAYGHDYPYGFAKLPATAREWKRTARNIQYSYRYDRASSYTMDEFRRGRRAALGVYKLIIKPGHLSYAEAARIMADAVDKGNHSYWFYDGFVGVIYQFAARAQAEWEAGEAERLAMGLSAYDAL